MNGAGGGAAGMVSVAAGYSPSDGQLGTDGEQGQTAGGGGGGGGSIFSCTDGEFGGGGGGAGCGGQPGGGGGGGGASIGLIVEESQLSLVDVHVSTSAGAQADAGVTDNRAGQGAPEPLGLGLPVRVGTAARAETAGMVEAAAGGRRSG